MPRAVTGPGPEEVQRVADLLARIGDAASLLPALFAHAPWGLQVISADGRSLVVNPAFCRLFGSEPPPGYNLLQDEIARERGVLDLVHRALSGETVSVPPIWYDPRDLRQVEVKEGRRVAIKATLFPLKGADGAASHVVIVFEDVTEQLTLEAQVREAARMEAFGQLAGGIAHDFNNLLTVVLGYADALLRTSPAGPTQGAIREIRDAAERASALSRQLLAVGRGQPTRPQVIDLGERVRSALGMLRGVVPEEITLADHVSTGVNVCIDPGHVEQIVLNLALNARDAMPTGGALAIEVGEVDDSRGRRARIAVSDTGVGMDEATLERMFEPFFTTKGGGGTGLGLATVYGLVHQAGGEVHARSEPGRGTTVTVELPIAAGAPESTSAAPAPEAVAGGHETVLLVEDEPAVRLFAARVLREAGYTVLEAPDGTSGLFQARVASPAIDLVVTELVLPGLTGRALLDQIRAERADVRVLLLTGSGSRDGDPEAPIRLTKPFRAHELLGAVREALDAPPASSRGAPSFSLPLAGSAEGARLAALIEIIPAGVYIGDATGIHFCNAEGLRQLGFGSLRELRAEIATLASRIQTRHADTGERQLPEDEPFAHALRGEPCVRDVLVTHLRTGEERIVRCQAAPLRSEGQVVGAIAVNTDVTELRALERAERDADRTKAISRLAGGLAHELNNLAMAALGQIFLALRRLPEGHPSAGSLGEVRGLIERMAAVADQLLAFTRRRVIRPEVVDLRAILARVRETVRTTAGPDVRWRVEAPDAGELLVRADPDQLLQALGVLVVNALDALGGGGELDVVALHEPGSVRVEVRDTGPSLSAEEAAGAFEPYVAVRGGRHGLLLASVRGAVEQMGGSVGVEAEPGRTTFWYRVLRAPAPVVAERVLVPALPPGGVLVVDDEDPVRDVVGEVLEQEGYQVTRAADGVEALERIGGGDIALVVTDIVMPRMGGRDLVGHLRRDHPDVGIIVMSADSGDREFRKQIVEEAIPFLQKPFAPERLIELVRSMLGSLEA